MDKDSARSIKAIETWGGHSFCCIQHAMEDFGIDVAVVATNDGQHYEPLKQLAEYPLKLVICEKPLCDNLQHAREVVALYKAKGIPLMVDYTRRFLPVYEDLRQRYWRGELGECLYIQATFNRGFLHSGSHAADFIHWFGGNFLQGIPPYQLKYVDGADYRIWQLDVYFENYHWREERIGDMPVPAWADHHMRYVAENAHNFLEGREALKCTGEDSLRSLEMCFELMGASQ